MEKDPKSPFISSSDEHKISENKALMKALDPGVFKYNYKGKKQERILVITNKNVINLIPDNVINNMLSKLAVSIKMKRKISLQKISGVTLSRIGFEFVIHVPDEYDYRFSSPTKRDSIIEVLTDAFLKFTEKDSLAFFYKDDLNLINYTTTKFDIKKGICRRPTESPMSNSAVNLPGKTLFTNNKDNAKLDDFKLVKVMLVEHKKNAQIFAMKSIRKEDIIEKDQLEHTKSERKILEHVIFANIYSGGELFQHLKNERRFSEERTKFYTAEIILALEYLHNQNIIYRDLKPENILLDDEGHIVLTDFGLARFMNKNEKATTFVGTPEYLAPEILANKGHNHTSDWWSLGTLIFEMIVGLPPFYHTNQNIMFQLIRQAEVRFPKQLKVGEDIKDLILKLTPPFKPKITGKFCVDNFDEEFTNEDPINSVMPQHKLDILKQYQDEFSDFTYAPEDLKKMAENPEY